MQYFIGDVHSNSVELKKLLDQLKLKKSDTLIFLGDYVDKNINTKETLEILWSLNENYKCIFIKGNHEYVWEKYLNNGEYFRQDFLLKYGSAEALRQYVKNPKELILKNDVKTIKKLLEPYLKLIEITRDYYLTDKYLAIHAGLLKEQLDQKEIKMQELNYFLRKDKIDFNNLYLNKYVIVAGHSYFGDEPLVEKGYISIDLGAGFGRYLGALDSEGNKIIRSDGKIFDILKKYE